MTSNLRRSAPGIHRLSRHFLAGTAGIAALLGSGRALADPLDVTTAVTTPVTTAGASNSSAGDVTIESAGSVIVTDTGPAVTVNSANAVTNAGTIGSSATTGATALLVDGTSPISTTITNNGTISVTGTGGSGNYGLRLTNGPVTGTIASSTASTISVTGTGAIGVSIESPFTGNVTLNSVSVAGDTSTAISLNAPLTGNLRLTGTNASTGNGGIGVFAGDISGSFVNAGTVVVGAATTSVTDSAGTTTTGPGVGGQAGISLSGNVGGGFLNDRYYVDSTGAIVATASATSSDTLITGTVTGYGGSPAVLVAPSSTAPENITLGAVGAAGTVDGYGFVNRGSITSAGNVVGRATTGVQIGGTTVDGVLYTTTLAGGLVNQANGAISASTSGAAATAIDIGPGAIVPTLLNQGTIAASDGNASTGTTVYGVRVEAGASLGSITNSGTISTTSAAGGLAGYAILDQAGTLSTIVNSGTISATASTAGSTARAIDLSAGTAAQSVTNSGTIKGDILFGSGAASYVSNSGAFTGTIAFGTGSSQMTLAGASNFYNPVTVATGGALDVAVSGTSSLRFAGTLPTLASLSLADQSNVTLDVGNGLPALQVTGAASFTGTSTIKLNILQPGSRTLTILTAAGGVRSDHAATLLGATSTPYIYSLAGFSVDANDIQVTLHQKTAAEAGFAAAVAPLYEQSFAAMATGGSAFDAIASLTDQASVLAAYRQIAPPNYGSAMTRIAESLQSSGAGAVSARLNSLATSVPGEAAARERFALWAQQSGEFLRHKDSQDDPGFSSNGILLNFGGDYRLAGGFVVGAAANFAWTDVGLTGQATDGGKPLTISTQMADLYASWSQGPFYVQAIGSAGHNDYKFGRTISIGSYSAVQNAKWSGNQFAGSLIAGARFAFGRFRVEPSDAFTYLRLHQNGYTETGADVLDLAVDSQRVTTKTNTSKLAVGYEYPIGTGAISFGARGAYVARLDRSIPGLDANFTAGGSAFTLATAPLARSSLQEGGTIAYHAENFLLSLNGDRRQESGFSDTSVSATLRISF